MAFATEQLGATSYTGADGPDPWQCDVLEAVLVHRLVAVRSPHGVGKTSCACFCVHWHLCTHPFSKVPITAPTFETQVRDIFFAELHGWTRRSRLRRLLAPYKTKLAVKGAEDEWFAVGFGAGSNAEHREGFHAPGGVLYIFDEAKGVPKTIWDAARGALTGEHDRMLVISTPPLAPIGEFVKVFTTLRHTWKTFAIPPTPRQDPAWRAEREREWPPGSPEHESKILGHIPRLGGDDTVIPLGLIEAAMQAPPVAMNAGLLGTQIGCDVARYGSDETVFALRRGAVIGPLEIRTQQDTFVTSGELRQWLLQGYSRANVDDVGLGAGVIDPLLHDPEVHARVAGVNFGGAADDPERFYDRGTELWFALKGWLEDGLVLPNDEDLAAQLASRRFKWVPNRKGLSAVRKLESKDEMKARGLKSPDRADAVVLACATPPRGAESLSVAEMHAAWREGGHLPAPPPGRLGSRWRR